MDLQTSFTALKSTKFPTKPILDYPPHLKYVAALPGKTLKIRNFALFMHVKHASKRDFFIVYPTDVMKISAKINTMQDINILLFVRSLP